MSLKLSDTAGLRAVRHAEAAADLRGGQGRVRARDDACRQGARYAAGVLLFIVYCSVTSIVYGLVTGMERERELIAAADVGGGQGSARARDVACRQGARYAAGPSSPLLPASPRGR